MTINMAPTWDNIMVVAPTTVQYAKVQLLAACARAIGGSESGGHSALEILVLFALPGACRGGGRGADRGRRRQTTPNGISWATLAGAEIQGKHNVWVKAPTGLLGQGLYTLQLPAVGGACGSNCGRNNYVFARGRAFPDPFPWECAAGPAAAAERPQAVRKSPNWPRSWANLSPF
jgi:hypothetical protein